MNTVQPSGEVSVENTPEGVAVVALIGEHDLGTLPSVNEAIAGAPGSLVIDLSRTRFVDSSILGAVLGAQRERSQRGDGFAVVCEGAADAVIRVLEVTGLNDELPLQPSREAAVEAAAGRAETA